MLELTRDDSPRRGFLIPSAPTRYGVTMGTSLKIRDELTPLELRRWARKEARGWPAARAYAIANALEGMNRAEAARLAGMERQAHRLV